MPAVAPEALQAAVEVFVEVALDGASRDIGVGGDLIMGQVVALEPENLHLALDPGVWMMIPVVGQGVPHFGGETDRPHDGSPRCRSQIDSRPQFMPMSSRLQLVPVLAALSISQVLNRAFSRYSSLAAHFNRLVSIPRRQLVSRFRSPKANRRMTLRLAGACSVGTR